MVVSARGKEIWVEEKNDIIEDSRSGLDGGLIEGLQELLPYICGEGFDLKRVRWVFVDRVATRGPLQISDA